MKKLFIVLLGLLLNGCAATAPIPDTYLPLTTLSERPWYASFLGGENTATTVGDTVYVEDVKNWLEKLPEGSPRYEAIMQHERVHSYRQLKRGLSSWMAAYLSSSKTRWDEERLGWFIQLKIYRERGQQIDIEGIAHTLASYKPHLIDEATATQWVKDVLYGRWKPNPSDLPPALRRYAN